MKASLNLLSQHREFRLLFFGQWISRFGSIMSYVALPYVMYESTGSTIMTGLIGVIQLIPSIVGALFGGVLADSMERKKLILVSESIMAISMLALGFLLSNRLEGGSGTIITVFVIAALMAVMNGFHRPALEAITQMILEKSEMQEAAVLGSIQSNSSMILGPAVAGIIIARYGVAAVFFLDFISYLAAMATLILMRPLPSLKFKTEFNFKGVREGFRYAMSRPELIGTYIVDIIAMTFSMPNLLFPVIAKEYGNPAYLGWLHSGISIGALVATLLAIRMKRWRRHGVVVLWSAALWSVFMCGFGWTTQFELALGFLVLAGFADMISGVFRQTIWNETIPTEMRGRLAGIEMISYLSGPMLGNTQLGFFAVYLGVHRTIQYSSLIGLILIVGLAVILTGFRSYTSQSRNHAT